MSTIYIFRRDFRIIDNVGWSQLAGRDNVLPVFIFNPAQIDSKRNAYFSNNAVQFMCESLEELRTQFCPPLRYFYGEDIKVLNALHKELGVKCVVCNADYTPFARKRDADIKAWCEKHEIEYVTNTADYSLVDPVTMEKPYQVFTPFFKKYSAPGMFKNPVHAIRQPIMFLKRAKANDLPHEIPPARLGSFYVANANLAVSPGRHAALTILTRIKQGHFKMYENMRDLPALSHGTTRLSSYIKFGCVSVREVRTACIAGNAPELLRQVYWRAFYDQVTWHFPHVLQGQVNNSGNNLSMKPKWDEIKWKHNEKWFTAWREGRTGFDFVDAGIHQLLKTGYMHNRLRMVVASFLVKDLHIDWREGEKFFAQHLVDYDPSANNGGWQWVAGTGADAQPYHRIFNPLMQQAKFDPDGAYIASQLQDRQETLPTPIVDHAKERLVTQKMYKL